MQLTAKGGMAKESRVLGAHPPHPIQTFTENSQGAVGLRA